MDSQDFLFLVSIFEVSLFSDESTILLHCFFSSFRSLVVSSYHHFTNFSLSLILATFSLSTSFFFFDIFIYKDHRPLAALSLSASLLFYNIFIWALSTFDCLLFECSILNCDIFVYKNCPPSTSFFLNASLIAIATFYFLIVTTSRSTILIDTSVYHASFLVCSCFSF